MGWLLQKRFSSTPNGVLYVLEERTTGMMHLAGARIALGGECAWLQDQPGTGTLAFDTLRVFWAVAGTREVVLG